MMIGHFCLQSELVCLLCCFFLPHEGILKGHSTDLVLHFHEGEALRKENKSVMSKEQSPKTLEHTFPMMHHDKY